MTGISLGGRYDGSPLIISDGSEPPADSANAYEPSATPGGRAPHAWLSDGRSLYDAFNFEYTLLRFVADGASAPFVAAAQARGIPLVELDLSGENLRPLYEADFAIVRPDQIVCWRGDALPIFPNQILDRISGRFEATALR